MTRRLIHLAAIVLAALALGLVLAACGGGQSDEQAAADRQAEARWQVGIERWSADMLGALNGVSILLGDAASVDRLRAGEKRTTSRLARFERTLNSCTATIRRLGTPPAVLAPIREGALRACRHLEEGSRHVHDGVAGWRKGGGIASIVRAGETLGIGQQGVTHVLSRMKAELDG